MADGAQQRLGGGALQEGARLGVDGAAREVVRRGVADVELDGLVELHQLDQVGRAERALLLRRPLPRADEEGKRDEKAEERREKEMASLRQQFFTRHHKMLSGLSAVDELPLASASGQGLK